MGYEVEEPLVDPLAPAVKADAVPKNGPVSPGQMMPPPARVPAARGPKVSPRCDWRVDVILDGNVYGPFVIPAVDESEAICRVLDSHVELKAFAVKAKFNVAKVE